MNKPNKSQLENSPSQPENIENLLYENSNKIEDVNKPNKSQLENSLSQSENLKNLLYKSDNKMENVNKSYKPQLENSSSQLENIATQFILISININDLVDKYTNVNIKKRIIKIDATITILKKN